MKKTQNKINQIHKVYGKIYASVNVTFPKVLQKKTHQILIQKFLQKKFQIMFVLF